MLTSDYVIDHVTRLCGPGEELVITRNLMQHLAQHPKTNHITFQFVKQLVTNDRVSDVAVGRALQILAGDHLQVLKLNFEIFDEDEISHDLSEDEVRSAVEANINPLTGTEDRDVRSKILVYFTSTLAADQK